MKTKLILMTAALVLGSLTNARTDAPKTLFELSGVPRPAIEFNHSILIIIDAQQEYENGKLPLVGLKDAVKNIHSLLVKAREEGVPVIHIMHEGSKNGLFDPTTNAFKSIEGLESLSSETVILKHLPDSFAGTRLLKELERFGRDRSLVLVGFMTHMCITSTASSALNLGFQSFVVQDAVATRDLKGSNGETVPAKQVGEASLAALQDRIAWVVNSSDILK